MQKIVVLLDYTVSGHGACMHDMYLHVLCHGQPVYTIAFWLPSTQKGSKF